MKNKYLYTSILSLCLAALTLTGCNQEEQYIKLDEISYTFEGAGNEPKIVTMSSNPGMTVTPSATWIKITDITATSFTITVEDNETGYFRTGTITLRAGGANQEFNVAQLMQDSESARFRKLSMLNYSGFSPNGKYAGGYYQTIDETDTYISHPVIIDLETDEWTEIGAYSINLMDLADVHCVTDQGVVFISDGQFGGCYGFDVKTMDYIQPKSPAGFQFKPTIERTSADGTIWVGFAVERPIGDGGLYHPLKFTNGTPETLPMPEQNFRDEEFWVGIMARGCSADGSVIYGSTWDNSDFGMVYWKDGKVDYAGGVNIETGEPIHKVWEDTLLDGNSEPYAVHMANGMICQAQQYLMSPNGKYLAGTYRTEKKDSRGMALEFTHKAAFFNTETGKTRIIEDYEESIGIAASDDGIGFVGNAYLGTTAGYVYNIENGTYLGTAVEWIKENYGINIPTGYVNYITPDSKLVYGTSAEASAGGVGFKNWYVGPNMKK